jgi:hypothetical protein
MNLFKWWDFTGWVSERLLQCERSLAALSMFVFFLALAQGLPGFAYGQEQTAAGNASAKYAGPEACKTCHEDIYQKPYAGVAFDVKKGFAFKTMWTYYGCNPRSVPGPPGLAPIGSQEFNANNVTLALRYSF